MENENGEWRMEKEALRKEVSDLKASLEFNDKELRDVKISLAKTPFQLMHHYRRS